MQRWKDLTADIHAFHTKKRRFLEELADVLATSVQKLEGQVIPIPGAYTDAWQTDCVRCAFFKYQENLTVLVTLNITQLHRCVASLSELQKSSSSGKSYRGS